VLTTGKGCREMDEKTKNEKKLRKSEDHTARESKWPI